jgi:hypothetical protein
MKGIYMKKYYYLFFVMLLGLFLSACEDSTTDPEDEVSSDRGSIYIQSTPAGASILVDGTSSGKVTPDSVTNLTAGSHTVTLKLANYKDTTFTLTVNRGLQTSKSVTLTSDVSFVTYTDTVWETSGTTAAQPSGIDLSTGTAVSTSNTAHDIYYTSTGFVIRTSSSRNTVFYVGSGTDLNDGTDSPLAQNSGQGGWTDRVGDREENYFFLFDQDLHYTKMKIISYGGGTPGNPAWVIVQWHYNTVANDQRF